jgi:parvulin-like peptidyl-prolyl isomerase
MTLPGCQGRKVVARVNSETINEDDFTARALHVTNLNAQSGLDAGGLTLVNMVKENLLQQLAKSKGVNVTDDQVNKYIAAIEKLNPQILEGVRTGKITQEDLNREYRNEMILFGLGTDNAKADAKELQASYDQHKADLTIKGSYKLRLLPLQDRAKAQQALTELKASGDFKKAAAIGGLPPEVATNLGKETAVPASQTPPQLKAALDALKPLAYTAEPVPLQGQNGQQFYLIAQLIDKTTDRVLTMDEAKALVERFALADKFPQWGQHAESALNDFITQSKDKIEINLDRYKPLKEQFILPKPKALGAPDPNAPGAAPNAPVPGASAPGAPVPGASAPGAPVPGASAPGGPSAAPPSSAPAPGGAGAAAPSGAPAPGGKM